MLDTQEGHVLGVECMDPYELDKLSLWDPQLQRCWEPSPVLDWIQEGYKLPLIREPVAFIQTNHKSALDHSEFVTEAVNKLLKYQCDRSGKAATHL